MMGSCDRVGLWLSKSMAFLEVVLNLIYILYNDLNNNAGF